MFVTCVTPGMSMLLWGGSETSLTLSDAILVQVGDLVAADNVAFARLVLKHLPEKHVGFVARLQSQPEKQYRQDPGSLGLHAIEDMQSRRFERNPTSCKRDD